MSSELGVLIETSARVRQLLRAGRAGEARELVRQRSAEEQAALVAVDENPGRGNAQEAKADLAETTATAPAHLDPAKLFVDVESLLGRAAAAGMATGDLPAIFADTLMAWLRARALGFAQQQRTGIALGRQQLHRGVVLAWTCLDEGLRLATSADVVAAIIRLAEGDLIALYKAGYESLFLRLAHLRDASASWLADTATLALLPEAEAALRRWSRLVAETWIVPAADDSETPIEPHAELRDFCEMEQALTFAASLPRATTRQLLSTEPDFAVAYRCCCPGSGWQWYWDVSNSPPTAKRSQPSASISPKVPCTQRSTAPPWAISTSISRTPLLIQLHGRSYGQRR